jgi:hypothetical protein
MSKINPVEIATVPPGAMTYDAEDAISKHADCSVVNLGSVALSFNL